MSHVSSCSHTMIFRPQSRRAVFFTAAKASGSSWSRVSPALKRPRNSSVFACSCSSLSVRVGTLDFVDAGDNRPASVEELAIMAAGNLLEEPGDHEKRSRLSRPGAPWQMANPRRSANGETGASHATRRGAAGRPRRQRMENVFVQLRVLLYDCRPWRRFPTSATR